MPNKATLRSFLPFLMVAAALFSVAVLLYLVSSLGEPKSAQPVSTPYGNGDELAAALFADPEDVAKVTVRSPNAERAISFPPLPSERGADNRLVLSTGDLAGTPGNAAPEPEVFSAEPDASRGGAFDVTVIEIEFTVGESMRCLVIPHLQFGSNEAVDVTDPLAEGFVLELDKSAWTALSGSSSRSDERVRLRASQGAGLEAEFAAALDLGLDLATPELQLVTPIEPGLHKLYLSVYDTEDAEGNSAISIGGLRATDDESGSCDGEPKLVDGSRLVALGDSNASGFGVPPFAVGTSEASGNNCQRSTRSYPALLALNGGYDFTSAACSGATTKDLYEANSSSGEAPQLELLRSDSGLVILTIGANDAAWFEAVQSCVLESILGPACNQNASLNQKFDGVLGRLAATEAQPARIRPYTKIFEDIRSRSPYAEIVVVTYPQLFPEGGGTESAGLFGANRCVGILKSDQRWINERTAQLANIAAAAAAGANVSVIDPSSKFAGHALCQEPSWFMDLSGLGPLHPNENGHAAIAQLISDEIAD